MFDSVGTPRTVAHQAPLSVGFPRQEYWSGLPFPSPRNLPDPGIEPMCPALAGRFFIAEPPGKPLYENTIIYKNLKCSNNSTDLHFLQVFLMSSLIDVRILVFASVLNLV